MEHRWIASAVALLVAVSALGACGGDDRERSEIELDQNAGDGGQVEQPAFPTTVAPESCCAHLCQALIDSGCTDLGTSETDCVNALCPIPDGLDDTAGPNCRVARGEALCCAWRVSGTECSGPPDPAGIGECASLATDADTACSP